MTGFEPRISGVGGDRSTNCATITVHSRSQLHTLGGSVVSRNDEGFRIFQA